MYTTSQSQYTQARKVKKRALALFSANRMRARPAFYSSARAAARREARIEVGRLKQIVQSGGETDCGKGPRSFVCTV